MFFEIVLAVAIATAVNGQVQFEGKCQNVTTQHNFSVEAYLGKWYEIAKYETIFQKSGECVTADYSMLPNGTVGVKNSMRVKGALVTISGTATEANPELKDGKLNVKFPSVGNFNASYWVLGTDYKNYSVVWSCTQLGNKTNFQFLWVLSRTPNITDVNQKMVDEIIQTNGLNKERLTKTNQTHCWMKHRSAATNVGLSLTLIALTSTFVYLFVY